MGGGHGEYTKLLAAQFPFGQVFVFESDREVFDQLASNIESLNNISAIPSDFYEEWCENNGIAAIDYLRFDAKFSGLGILKSHSASTKNISVVSVKLDFSSPKMNKRFLQKIRYRLELFGFKFLVQWIMEGVEGEMLFIRKDIYDSIFN